MSKTAFPVPTSRSTALATAAVALLVLSAAGAEAQAPMTPRSIQPTPAPGSLQSGQADLVPFLDETTLVRHMKNEQVRVSPDGRREPKIIAKFDLCAGLSPGASRQVTLPDIRWGVRNEVPRSVAGGAITVATVDRPFKNLVTAPGLGFRVETVDQLAPGASRQFVLPRPEPKTIQVTLFEVPARAKPTPTPVVNTGVNSVRVNSPRPVNPDDLASRRCVANILVRDAEVRVQADDNKQVKETNEDNNNRVF